MMMLSAKLSCSTSCGGGKAGHRVDLLQGALGTLEVAAWAQKGPKGPCHAKGKLVGWFQPSCHIDSERYSFQAAFLLSGAGLVGP